jgi:hypothetical protein
VPEDVPVTEAEVDMFEARLGDLFDEFCRRAIDEGAEFESVRTFF